MMLQQISNVSECSCINCGASTHEHMDVHILSNDERLFWLVESMTTNICLTNTCVWVNECILCLSKWVHLCACVDAGADQSTEVLYLTHVSSVKVPICANKELKWVCWINRDTETHLHINRDTLTPMPTPIPMLERKHTQAHVHLQERRCIPQHQVTQ